MTSDDLNKPPPFKGCLGWFARFIGFHLPSFHPSHAFDTQGSQRLDDIHRQGTYQATGIGRKGVEGIRRLLVVWGLPRGGNWSEQTRWWDHWPLYLGMNFYQFGDITCKTWLEILSGFPTKSEQWKWNEETKTDVDALYCRCWILGMVGSKLPQIVEKAFGGSTKLQLCNNTKTSRM